MSETRSRSPVSLAAMLQLSPRLTRILMLGVSGLLCLLLLGIFQSAFHTLEERVGALGWTLSPDTSLEERITLVVIDEASIAEVGPWPWERGDMARLVTAISDAGAQLQLHDITFPEPRPGDEQFAAALANADAALLSQTPALAEQANITSTGLMTHAFTGLACDSAAGGIQLPLANGFIATTAGLAGVAKGHNSLLIDRDGAVRNTPALVCSDGLPYPALSIAAFLQLGSSDQWSGNIETSNGFLGPEAVLTLSGYPGLDIPLDAEGNLRVSFAKSPDSFRAVSAIDVINGSIETDMFDNAWVLVGVTAFGTGDIVPTPYSGAAYGVELHARLLASLLDVDVPYTPAGSSWLLLLISLLIAAISFGLASAGDRVAAYGLPIAAIVLPLMALTLHVLVLASNNVWLGWIAPAFYGVLAASTLLLLELARTRFERARVFGNLNSYLPDDVAREIAFSLPTSNVNAHRKDVTLLNADLRNFSAFGEARPPEEIAAVLHFFFTRATEIIESHDGTVQEFKGDSLLAMWDAADSVSATKALQSAKEMQEALNDTLLPQQALEELEPLALGIGIEQGPVLVGSIGPAHRRSHTLLGDTVSITLRIQEMTAELARPILVGECAARQLSGEQLESQGSYLLSGLRIPHTLFSPAAPISTALPSSHPRLTVVSGGKS